jgi:hypothetical protein
MSKNIQFDLNKNRVYITYSREEYDRSSIDHVLYRRAYRRISDDEMNSIYVNLDLYKLYEMPVHKTSFKNNSYHIKRLIMKA